jgi:fatty-acyl-CoA synthase
MTQSQYSRDLDANPANYTPLSPVTFLERASAVYPEHPALIYGDQRQDWAETYCRCRRFASALAALGIGDDDTVAVMLPNIPAMYEAHFAIPMAGAVIHALNIRLDADRVSTRTRRRASIADRPGILGDYRCRARAARG